MKAMLATAMASAATQPPTVICRGRTKSATIFRLVAL
jgi:hypothetical protein